MTVRECDHDERNRIHTLTTDRYEDIYDDHILDHFECPYHKGRLEKATCAHAGKNPLCGDKVELQLLIDGGRVAEAYFDGKGCAISQAAASILCETIEGKTLGEIENLQAKDMLDLLKVPLTPTRQKCGLLGFKVLKTMVYSLQPDGETAGPDRDGGC